MPIALMSTHENAGPPGASLSWYVYPNTSGPPDWSGAGPDWTSGASPPVGRGYSTTWGDGRRSWDGLVDVGRVVDVVKDAILIRLVYESQREGQKLVTLGEVESCE